MKIAIIDPFGTQGGMHYYNNSLLKEVLQCGHRSYLFSNYKCEIEGLQSYKIFKKGKRPKPIYYASYFIGIFLSCIRCKALGINRVIIHLFGVESKDRYLSEMLSLFRIQYVAILHDVEGLGREGNALHLNRIFNACKFTIVHNQFSLKEFRKKFDHLDATKLMVARHGNYLDHIPKHNTSSLFEVDNECVHLLFFGQIKKVKGLDLLLQA
jgi:D-inositol-3-phosphate glycosyltransferase